MAMFLKTIRVQKCMSQADLAQASGVAEATISQIETGKAKARFVTRRKLVAALGMKPEDVSFDKPKPFDRVAFQQRLAQTQANRRLGQ